MTDTNNPITLRAFREAEGTEDWRVLAEGACAFFRTESFAASTELVRAFITGAPIDRDFVQKTVDAALHLTSCGVIHRE